MADIYTLHNSRTNASQQFTDAREAGAAFFDAEPSDHPAVIHSMEDSSARAMAVTEVRGTYENGEQRFVKILPNSHKGDAEFRGGYMEALERSVNERLGQMDRAWENGQQDQSAKVPVLDYRLIDDLDALTRSDSDKGSRAWKRALRIGDSPQAAQEVGLDGINLDFNRQEQAHEGGAKAKGAASSQRGTEPQAEQGSEAGQAAPPLDKPVAEALTIDAEASVAVDAKGGDANQGSPSSHTKEVEVLVPDAKSVDTLGPESNSTPSTVSITEGDGKKRKRTGSRAKAADQAGTAPREEGDSAKRKSRARRAAETDDEALLNGIDAPVRESETKLTSGAAAYVDPRFRTVAIEQGDKVYLLGGAAAIEKFVKQAQLNDKDNQALRELHRQASEAAADPYELEVLKRVAQLRRMRNQQVRNAHDQAEHKQLLHDEIRERAMPAAPAKDAIPAELQKLYLKVANKYYHADRPDALAFVDKGERLETKSNSERTAGNLVAIAEARGWDSVKVSGSETFRREAWLEASARGMLVRGYKATDVDRALLEHRIANGRSNAVERDEAPVRRQDLALERPEPAQEGNETSRRRKAAPMADSEPARAAVGAPRTGQQGRRNSQQISGILLEHGPANYKFDPDESTNYYVKLLDKGQERVVWGVLLGRAIQKSGAREGDRVVLERTGTQAVEVDKNVRDDAGKVVGYERAGAERNGWKVTVSEESKRMRAAEDFRNLPLKDAAERHPDQVAAAGILAAATVVAREKFADDKARKQFLDETRKRVVADMVAGRAIRDVRMHRTPTKEREQARQQAPEIERAMERSR